MGSARKEKYLVRPFAGLSTIDDGLAGVRLAIGDVVYEPGAYTVDSNSLTEADYRVTLPDASALVEAVAASPLSAEDCALVVIAAGRLHRVADILYHVSPIAAGSSPSEIRLEVGDGSLALGDPNGWTVTVAVVLAHGLRPEPLRPSRPGTWLARRDFRISPERDETSFSPQELTDDIRERYKLPATAPSFVLVDAERLSDAEAVSDAVDVYIERDVLRLLQQNQSDVVAQHIQADLAVETLLIVVAACLDILGEGVQSDVSATDVEDYPAIARLFERLAKRLGKDMHELIVLAGRPAEFATHLRAAFGMQAIAVKALRGSPISDGGAR